MNTAVASAVDLVAPQSMANGGRGDGGAGCRIQLMREGYYTSPPFHQLKKNTECGIYSVEKLTIGKVGFGSITFDCPIDIKDLNLDDIVEINHKEVIVYPHEDQKPPVGHGLNCAAEVRLEKVWPLDGCASKYVTDPQALEEIAFVEKLKKTNQKCSTTFLKYIPESGSWIFKVEHFSKYGLPDTDDEGDEELEKKDIIVKKSEEKALKQTNAASLQKKFTPGEIQCTTHLYDEDGVAIMTESYSTPDDIASHVTDTLLKPFCLQSGLGVSQEKIMAMRQAFFPEVKESGDGGGTGGSGGDIDNGENATDSDEDYPFDQVSSFGKSPTRLQAVSSPRPLHIIPKYNLHLDNKYSPKKMGTNETKRQFLQLEDSPHPKGTLIQRPPLESVSGLIKTATFFPHVNLFETSTYKYPNLITPRHETSTNRLSSRSLKDLNIYKGHGSRVGWGPGGVLLILTTQRSASTLPLEAGLQDLDKYLQGRSADDNSKQIVQRICLRGGRGLSREVNQALYENELREYLGRHLKVKLKHSDFYEDQRTPAIKPVSGSATVTFHDSLRLKDDCNEREYAYNVWGLCEALWGELPEYVPPVNSHKNLMLRKQYLGDWLTFVYRKTLLTKPDGKLYSPKDGNNDSYLEEIWSLVTGNMIKDACNLARRNGDTFVVTLLTQLSSGQFVNHLLREQLTHWNNVRADAFIKRDRLKLFLLLSASPLYNGSDETVNVCERLDWKRTLGLHLWYLTSKVQSIKDAFTAYQMAFHPKDFFNLYAKAPFPPYCEEGYIYDPEEKLPPLDLCYHLINLYCDRFYSMAKMFDPITHTLDVLDYSLSWLVYISLDTIGYHHTSEYGAAQVHSSFAAQLESYGMWEWAVFVLLHIPDANRRQVAVKCMLERNLCTDGNKEYKQKECFVKHKLRIPAKWIYEMKAHRSLYQGKYHFAVCFLIKAKQFDFAHKILMKHLAPQYVLNEKYEELKKLLKPLAVESRRANRVYNWNKGGCCIWLYLEVMSKIKYLQKHPEPDDEYELECVQVDALRLCKLLPQFAVNTPIDKVCRTELSDKLFDLIGEFVKLQRDDPMSCRTIMRMSTKLPISNNFKLLERKVFIINWPADFRNCRLFT